MTPGDQIMTPWMTPADQFMIPWVRPADNFDILCETSWLNNGIIGETELSLWDLDWDQMLQLCH